MSMKYLYVIRHAKSSWDDPSLSDFDRPLNQRGKRDAPFMAKLLSETLDAPGIMISSPARRAKTTALHFHREFGIPSHRLEFDEDLYHADVDTMVGIVEQIDDKFERAAIFGHNPGFTSFVNIIGQADLSNVPTTGVVVLESEADSWKNFTTAAVRSSGFYYPKKYISR